MIADPHCHTIASDGMVSPAELVKAAVDADLDLIAVTDHDTMDSVNEARAHGESGGIVVVAGQEVTTKWPSQTHVMGWFLDKPVKRGMSVEDTVAAIHDQGGLAIIPHPFMPVYFGSIQPGMLRRLIDKQQVDGIEMVFTVPIGKRRRALLDDFYAANRERLGAAVGASDCHFGPHDIGSALTEFEGGFRAAMLARSTVPRRPPHAGRAPPRLAPRPHGRAPVGLPLRGPR